MEFIDTGRVDSLQPPVGPTKTVHASFRSGAFFVLSIELFDEAGLNPAPGMEFLARHDEARRMITDVIDEIVKE